jgi:anti-sigma-K factor RskA
VIAHEEANGLLATFSLDAVERAEHEQVERHLSECPRCRAELDAHRDVAAAMGNSVEPLPEGLWSMISSRLPARHDQELPPMPTLRHEELAPAGVETPPSNELSFRRPSRRRTAVVGSVAAAAAVVATILGVNLVSADNQVAHLQGALSETGHTAVTAALQTPGHRVVNLESAQHHQLAQFVVLLDGQGYLVHSALPTLSSKDTYQLWAVVSGQPISLGLIGRHPNQVTFTLAGARRPATLGLTVEPEGGSVVPTSTMLASGTV